MSGSEVKVIDPSDLDSACRLCLCNKNDQINIFSGNSSLVSTISCFLPFEVCEGDGLPAQICNECHNQLTASYRFYRKCQETDAILHHLVDSQCRKKHSGEHKIAIKEGVEDSQRVITIESSEGPASEDGHYEEHGKPQHKRETPFPTMDSQHEEDTCSIEHQLQAMETGSQVLGGVSASGYSVAAGTPEGRCPLESGTEYSCSKSDSSCETNHSSANNKTALHMLDQGNGPPEQASSAITSQMPCKLEAKTHVVMGVNDGRNTNQVLHNSGSVDANVVVGLNAGGNTSQVPCNKKVEAEVVMEVEDEDVVHAFSCKEINTSAVAGEEVTLPEVFTDFDDDLEYNYRLNSTSIDGEPGTVTEADVIACSDVHHSTGEYLYRLFSEPVHIEDAEDGEVMQNEKASGKNAQVDNAVADIDFFSGPVRMELHPACISVCNFECKLCSDKFMTRSDLKYHETLHIRRQFFECSVCYKLFVHYSKLEAHMRIHTGHKPYKCAVCDSSFTQRGTLQNHMKKHSRSRPFVCSKCGRGFFNREGLQVHMRLHRDDPLDIDLNECPLCDKAFVYPSGLSRHLALHNSQRFVCDLCHKDFRELPTLKRHMRNKHGFD